MSRKILTLVLTSVFVLSFGLSAFAQNADQKIEITGGTAPSFADDINGLNAKVGNAATYNYLVSINTNGLEMDAASLGLLMYSPDGSLNPSGATVSNAALTTFWNQSSLWGFGPGFNATMLDGSLPEQILYGGVGNTNAVNTGGGGLQNNAFDGALTFDVTFSGDGVFCVDSAFFPPATDFLAIDAAGNSIGPVLVGGSGDVAVGGASQTAFCVTSFLIPDLPPVCSGTNPTMATISHCDVYNASVTASDPDNENDPISYSITTDGAGTATVDNAGNVSYTPDASDANSSVTLTINAAEPDGPNTDCVVTLMITNVAPTITCAADLAVAKGNTVTTPAPAGVSGDCDALSYSLAGVSPTPTGAVSIDAGTGAITFASAEADAPGVDADYTFTIEVTDGITTAQCSMTITVLNTAPFCVKIDKIGAANDVFQGGSESVDIIFEGGSNEVGGFDLLIQYDNSALSLAGVSEGSIYSTNGWEYFDFRFGPNGNCTGGCPSGKARVIGLADQNDGVAGGNTVLVSGDTFASLNFLVSNDRTLECQFVPIRFCWIDCSDNGLSSPGGDTLYISRNVFDYEGTDPGNQDPASAGRANITGSDPSFPTLTGAPAICLQGDGQKLPPETFVDFKNGGLKIACAAQIDARGDINLNGISNEIADAVIYTAYFVSGLTAFDGLIASAGPNAAQAAIAASEVNGDGIPLSVADLVYLIRIIVGDALPLNKLAHNANSVEFSTQDGVVSTDVELGAALFVFAGNADVKLLANNMNLEVGVVDGNTRALVFDIGSERIAAGEVLTASSELISVEAVDYNGNALNSSTTLVPSSFVVHQNYPNPFNPSTKISFDVPSASEYSVTIYNVAGQKVHEIIGNAGSAGTVLVEWNASDQASGIYFYNVKTLFASATKKMVLLK